MNRLPAPMASSDAVKKSMKGNRSKNTTPEITLRKALYRNGLGGYRIHWSKIEGNPDIAYPSKKVAIFVNGCFWHRCPYCHLPMPKNNSEYWMEKFKRNVARDQKNLTALESKGWKVIVIWECEIKNDLELCIHKILNALSNT